MRWLVLLLMISLTTLLALHAHMSPAAEIVNREVQVSYKQVTDLSGQGYYYYGGQLTIIDTTCVGASAGSQCIGLDFTLSESDGTLEVLLGITYTGELDYIYLDLYDGTYYITTTFSQDIPILSGDMQPGEISIPISIYAYASTGEYSEDSGTMYVTWEGPSNYYDYESYKIKLSMQPENDDIYDFLTLYYSKEYKTVLGLILHDVVAVEHPVIAGTTIETTTTPPGEHPTAGSPAVTGEQPIQASDHATATGYPQEGEQGDGIIYGIIGLGTILAVAGFGVYLFKRKASTAPPKTPPPRPEHSVMPQTQRPWSEPPTGIGEEQAPKQTPVESPGRGAPLIPGYNIIRKLGSGGFSTVYLAEKAETGVKVALKIPKIELGATLSASLVDLFRKEAETWSRLDHPNIVRVLDYGVKPIPYIAMEYMEGGSLREKLENIRTFDLKEALRISLFIGEALSYAHHMGIIHRDLKPENILFDEEQNAKLTDFGLAKILLQASMSSATEFKGTLLYAAPEQVDPASYGQPDWRTDIWQYGAVLYEMLTGRPPFIGDNPLALINKILNEEPPPPSYYNPSIPSWVDELVLKCLKKNKDERWKSIELILERIHNNVTRL